MSPVSRRSEGEIPGCVPEGMEDVYLEFLSEAAEILGRVEAGLVELEEGTNAPGTIDAVFRGMHTLKGAAGFLNLVVVQDEAHAAETILARLREEGFRADLLDGILGNVDRIKAELRRDSPLAPTVRIDGATLDRLLELSGDLASRRTTDDGTSRVAHELRRTVLASRVQPIGEVFAGLPRIARDLGVTLGKKVELDLRGKEVEVDRAFLDVLGEMLVHLLRNAVDHGAEPPEERLLAGKNGAVRVSVTARHVVDGILVEVADDGRGVDTERVRSMAVARGLVDEPAARRLSEKESIELLFRPGFSTARPGGMLSGRGVGMDAVRSAAEEVGGHVTLESVKGKGTTVRIHLPSTLLGMPVLVFSVGRLLCALPRTVLLRAVPVEACRNVAGRRVLPSPSGLVPVVALGELLGVADAPTRVGLLCKVADQEVVFTVSAVSGSEEMLVKRLDPLLRTTGVYAGVGVLGDATAVLLDPAGVLRSSGVRPVASTIASSAPPPRARGRALIVSAGEGLYAVAEDHVERVVPASSAPSVSALPGFVVLGGTPVRVSRPDGLPPRGSGKLLLVRATGEALEIDAVHELIALPSPSAGALCMTDRGPAVLLHPPFREDAS